MYDVWLVCVPLLVRSGNKSALLLWHRLGHSDGRCFVTLLRFVSTFSLLRFEFYSTKHLFPLLCKRGLQPMPGLRTTKTVVVRFHLSFYACLAAARM